MGTQVCGAFFRSVRLASRVRAKAEPRAMTMQRIVCTIFSLETKGATKQGTYAVHFTLNAPTARPERVAAAIAAANTFYAASTKVPNTRFTKRLGMQAMRSLLLLGATMLANWIPAHTMTMLHRSTAPRKLKP